MGSVRDTMKTMSAMIASADFQTLTYLQQVIDSRTDDAEHSAQCSGRLRGQKTPRPERRKANTTNWE